MPAEVIKSIKFREPTGAIEAPFGTLVQLIRKGIYCAIRERGDI